MAEAAEGVIARRRARRRRHRRNLFLAALVTVLVAGGAGTAWAMRSSGGTDYRLATVSRGDVEQTVGADGTLAAHRTASAAFAASGSVSSVAVAVGDKVTAGQTLATLNPSSLDSAVTSAKTAVALARQQLADDEQAQADGTSSTSVSSTSGQQASGTTGTTDASATNSSAVTSTGDPTTAGTADAVLTAKVTAAGPSPAPAGSASGGSGAGGSGSGGSGSGGSGSGGSAGSGAGGSGGLAQAQQAVVGAQHDLDQAISAQDAYVKTLVKSCAATGSDSTPTTVPATPTNQVITGSVGSSAVVVTLLDANGDVATTTSANPQRLAAKQTYTFAGLDDTISYTVQVSRSDVISSSACTAAVTDVKNEEPSLDSGRTELDNAIIALKKAVTAQSTSSGTTGGAGSGQGSQGSSQSSPGTQGSAPSAGSGTGSGTTGGTGSGSSQQSSTGSSSTQSGTLVTAEQIAADSKAIDAAKAALAVARSDRSHATLTTPITGTVAAVDIAKGDSVSAGSSSQVVTVVGDGSLTIDLAISLADIDLIKAGQSAQVTVDGHTGTLPAKVTYVGQTNSSDSTGSSSTYTVSVQLTRTYPSLYDGMGADVSIDVGTVANTLTVPVSAVHTIGTRHTVSVDADGKLTTTAIALGLVGDSVAQVKSGLKAGQQVVLADIGAAVPSTDTNTTANRRGTFGGGTFGGPPGGAGGG